MLFKLKYEMSIEWTLNYYIIQYTHTCISLHRCCNKPWVQVNLLLGYLWGLVDLLDLQLPAQPYRLESDQCRMRYFTFTFGVWQRNCVDNDVC